MGSFNLTCGISNLVIRPGDPVVCTLIVANPNSSRDVANSYCYCNELYQPISLPFEAEYYDYGRICNIKESFVTEIIRDNFKIQNEKSLSSWTDDILLNNCLINVHKGIGNIKLPIGIWMVHKFIYDRLIDNEINISGRSSLFLKLLHDSKFAYEQLTNPTDENIIKAISSSSLDKLLSSLFYIRGSYYDSNSYLQLMGFNTVGESFGFVTHKYFNSYRLAAIESAMILNKEFWDIIAESFIKYKTIENEITLLRIGYMPHMGLGGQGVNYEAHYNLGKIKEELINQKKRDLV